MKTMLFLCTGNYYRSRFAEELFNHKAAREQLSWRAQSRALAIERGRHNVGPISPFALEALRQRAITAMGHSRLPQSCTADDLSNADCVVAVQEKEHRPLMRERFPQWEQHIRYWNIADVQFELPSVALAALEQEIDRLIATLRAAPD